MRNQEKYATNAPPIVAQAPSAHDLAVGTEPAAASSSCVEPAGRKMRCTEARRKGLAPPIGGEEKERQVNEVANAGQAGKKNQTRVRLV
jgi:hypothetical protein